MTKFLHEFNQKSTASSTVTQKALVHITATGTEKTADGDDDGKALEYIVMGHSIGEDGCTRPPEDSSFLVIAVVDKDLVEASLLEEDGIGMGRCCAFDVTEHFHVER